MRLENLAREAGVATRITEENFQISRTRHLEIPSLARSDISTRLILGKSAHSSIADNPLIPGKEEEKRLRRKTRTRRQKGPQQLNSWNKWKLVRAPKKAAKEQIRNSAKNEQPTSGGLDHRTIPDMMMKMTKMDLELDYWNPRQHQPRQITRRCRASSTARRTTKTFHMYNYQ